MADEHFIRYQSGQTVSNDLIYVNEETFVPNPGEILVPFPVDTYPNRYPDQYIRQPNNSLVPKGQQPLPQNVPDIQNFYTALFNDPIWGVDGDENNPPNNLRIFRPQLSMTRDSMANNLHQPLVIQAVWSDIKLGLSIQPGSPYAEAIIAMVEAHAITFNIPLMS